MCTEGLAFSIRRALSNRRGTRRIETRVVRMARPGHGEDLKWKPYFLLGDDCGELCRDQRLRIAGNSVIQRSALFTRSDEGYFWRAHQECPSYDPWGACRRRGSGGIVCCVAVLGTTTPGTPARPIGTEIRPTIRNNNYGFRVVVSGLAVSTPPNNGRACWSKPEPADSRIGRACRGAVHPASRVGLPNGSPAK